MKSAHNFSEDLFSLIKGEGNKGAGKPSSKLVGEELDLPWLSDNYRAVDVSSTVKVGGEVRDVSRRVYQRTDIDWDYISSHPDALGRSNRELAKQGNAPFHTDDARIELHHLTQTEPGGMVEIPGSLHDDYTNTLHGLVEDGGSFRNNPVLDKQYNNFNSKYWRWRIKQEK
ncbi:hypothetical protein BS101_02520 [Clostridium kluyveri]|uniref:LHH domain-containing protein n=1 Tax=Clostridium kluyveri TaxID=1534 RepID=A0A1L5FDU2_CLOKL|nr:hypothetical protein BS101_02520 [Clostridium kluyveri]